ncbi:hypothetical protein BAOM_0650 [Peribacillus asahii]|uniref:Uncharacterized protein n=1 Tax=Peribacillus asahii TaxID=228899 RepID=A0A3Q9RKF5_9BACI|nr:hypothetical protein BAOM_0650 [Peribacillus asahii]
MFTILSFFFNYVHLFMITNRSQWKQYVLITTILERNKKYTNN